jgi:redox-sensitive bicupin YhaK (pirin superfamily)
MEKVLHKAGTRGKADHGWLKSHHTFSFASYFNPSRMGFGALRVINDDVIEPSTGFGTHPHNNMEIISIPLSGALKHKDTMGNDFVIRKGEVQVMTAGTGVAHSEYNHSDEEDANFLQIWVMPKEINVEPSYSQKEFDESGRDNQFQLLVSPDGREGSVSINQDAYFSLARLSEGQSLTYKAYQEGNGAYFFLLDGELTLAGEKLEKRDGLGLPHLEEVELVATADSEVLVMEVPMTAQ